MCDKDHFAESVKEYEARGLITRRQFGVLVAAGVPMMLPAVANAQQTAERDVEIKTPDGTADAYFVYPATGSAAAVLIWPDIFGLRPAMRNDGQAARGVGLLGAGGQSVLSSGQADGHRCDADPGDAAVQERDEPGDGHVGCESVHRLARPAAAGEQEPQDRHAGLLHGRSDDVPHGIRRSRSRRRGGVVPRRRPRRQRPAPTVRMCWRRRRRRRSSSRSPKTTTSERRTRRTC